MNSAAGHPRWFKPAGLRLVYAVSVAVALKHAGALSHIATSAAATTVKTTVRRRDTTEDGCLNQSVCRCPEVVTTSTSVSASAHMEHQVHTGVDLHSADETSSSASSLFHGDTLPTELGWATPQTMAVFPLLTQERRHQVSMMSRSPSTAAVERPG